MAKERCHALPSNDSETRSNDSLDGAARVITLPLMARTKKGRPSTEGARLLAKWLSDNERSGADLAVELGVTTSNVTQWVGEVIRPRDHMRRAIERITGIPCESWMTAEERRIAEGPSRRPPSRAGTGGAAS